MKTLQDVAMKNDKTLERTLRQVESTTELSYVMTTLCKDGDTLHIAYLTDIADPMAFGPEYAWTLNAAHAYEWGFDRSQEYPMAVEAMRILSDEMRPSRRDTTTCGLPLVDRSRVSIGVRSTVTTRSVSDPIFKW